MKLETINTDDALPTQDFGNRRGENSPKQQFALWPPEPPPHPAFDHPLPHRGRGQGEGAAGDRGVHREEKHPKRSRVRLPLMSVRLGTAANREYLRGLRAAETLTHAEFVKQMRVWAEKGAAVP